MEEVQHRVSKAVNDLYTKLDVGHIRRIQRKAYLCSARCCESQDVRESVERCLELCAAPTVQAQKYVSEEMQRFQERLQRCVLSCGDKFEKPSDKVELERCVVRCGDEHIELLSSMFKRMNENLEKLQNN
jgi:hypothetical protein